MRVLLLGLLLVLSAPSSSGRASSVAQGGDGAPAAGTTVAVTPVDAAQGPGARPAPDAERIAADATVLVVDGKPIPAARYAEWLLQLQGAELAPVFAREHWLLEREARRRGVAPTPRPSTPRSSA
ncbi:MAG: hypothetical protein IPJ77_07500 [Planctomycetes bacterium]|nr:hypothetical protein [Planctomycetota bacterium]